METIIVFLYPSHSDTKPLMARPKIDPTWTPLPMMVCQREETQSPSAIRVWFVAEVILEGKESIEMSDPSDRQPMPWCDQQSHVRGKEIPNRHGTPRAICGSLNPNPRSGGGGLADLAIRAPVAAAVNDGLAVTPLMRWYLSYIQNNRNVFACGVFEGKAPTEPQGEEAAKADIYRSVDWYNAT
ncbi:hypothetical protein MKZ38_008303 [Zalerion maritima]|uniref:Uncharacterized protein n=1 Tax=Zalerion maritima TaxID=339359 RepID=A0AAD5WNP8_9PEZI|nr:hypothetical protein MKZ38_008303 [Zalerion maritima]